MATQTLKRMFLGKPLETEKEHEERLIKTLALAVFSSDAISSVAYATDEILLMLILAGSLALHLSLSIALTIVALLVIVVVSYRQVIEAYPNGGGAYVVASENLGPKFGLIAGASLSIDYVLTVAVSIAAGVAAITSAFPEVFPYRVELGIFFILIVTLANLRGVRESGKIFAIPTYSFIGGLLLLIGYGLYYSLTGHVIKTSGTVPTTGLEPLTLFLILRAFSSGCAALTGVEAVSNGVQAFRKPEAKNARITLLWMALILATIFLGVTYLAGKFHIIPVLDGSETVISQVASGVFGRGFFYYYIQATTALILVVAANTSFNGFPRVSLLMAEDGYLPRQLMNRGNKLAYSNGILALAFFSVLLIVMFKGDTHRLIPLYAVGVFTSFTLAQVGMVKHWMSARDKGWARRAVINGIGGIATFIVTMIIAVTKFMHGAWIVVVLIPVLMLFYFTIKRHYNSIANQLSLCNLRQPKPGRNHVILCIGGVHCGTMQALRYAKMIAGDDKVNAVYINIGGGAPTDIQKKWKDYGFMTELEIIPSPYRDIIGPIVEKVKKIHENNPDDFVSVVVPEFIVRKKWQHLLHNQTALILKTRLLIYPNVIVTSVPYQLD